MSSWPLVIERPQTRQIGLLPRGEPITLMMLSSNSAIPRKVRTRRPSAGDFLVNPPPIPVALAAVNAFHFCGIALAIWALVLTFIGVTREDFPSTDGAARMVAAISIILTVAAIGSGIYTAATEEEEGEGEEAALLLPR